MREGLELPWDYLLFMILIYTAYDISCIIEISPRPSLPPHTVLNPMTRPPRLVLNVLRGTALPLPGPEADNQNSRPVLSAGFSQEPRAKTASGFSVPLGLVAQEGSELMRCHLLTSG